MLDRQLVVGQPDLVRTMLRQRGAAENVIASVALVADLDTRRRALITEGDECRHVRKSVSPQIGQLMREGKRDEADGLKAEVKKASDRAKAIDEELAGVESAFNDILMGLPNLLADDTPEGKGDEDNVEVRRWGTPREFSFEPKAHDVVGTALGILDMERAIKLSGARFAVLKGAAARLERALINYFLDVQSEEHGYTEMMVPYIVSRDTMTGTGQLPKFESDLFKLNETVNGQDAFLIPTAEVPVTNLHREEIVNEADLPLQYCAFTPCFRSEAGSHGRDVKGLIRQHQFHKVELVWICTPEQSAEVHDVLTGHAEVLLQRLGLPYRVMRLCGGDVSASAAKCHDLEVWLPSQALYREISSCSNFYDYQARRMKLRFRRRDVNGKSKNLFCHTLNGSGLAVGRTLVAILENYQQSDGSVVIPEVLRPWMGGLDRITASA
jgi:seryl-tRNA synthetase